MATEQVDWEDVRERVKALADELDMLPRDLAIKVVEQMIWPIRWLVGPEDVNGGSTK